MTKTKINLIYDPQQVGLKKGKRRNWVFVFWGVVLLSQIAIIVFRISYTKDFYNTGDILSSCLNLLLPVIFIVQTIYSSRANRQAFVAFEKEEIRFRNQPGEKVTRLSYQGLRSVEQKVLGATFHARNGKKHHLSWEYADYDNIQRIKAALADLKEIAKSQSLTKAV